MLQQHLSSSQKHPAAFDHYLGIPTNDKELILDIEAIDFAFIGCLAMRILLNFATCVLPFVTLVQENAKDIMLTTARDAHKHAAAVPKNVEGWLIDESSHLLFYCLMFVPEDWAFRTINKAILQL